MQPLSVLALVPAQRVLAVVNRHALRAVYRTLLVAVVAQVEAAIPEVRVAVPAEVTPAVLAAVPVEVIPVGEVAQVEVATPEEATVAVVVVAAEVAEVTVAADKQLRTV